MKRATRAATALAATWLVACSLFNSPERAAPERRECDGGDCEDPCARCAPEASCERDAGATACVCPAGYVDGRGDGSRCQAATCERDEDCGPAAHCESGEGRAACACDDGYLEQGGRCRNVDECARGIDDCGAATVCVDRPGSFACECLDGYAARADGKSCDNIDECAQAGACGDNALCADTPGSHTCSCPAGYEGDPYTACRDRGECASGTLSCPSPTLCRDQDGPDRCACPRYMRDVDGKGATCIDDRIMGGLFFDSRRIRLADAPAFAEAPTLNGETMLAFTDGSSPSVPPCRSLIYELFDFGYISSGAYRIEINSLRFCEYVYNIDRAILLGTPFDAAGDALGGLVALYAKQPETGDPLCELQRRGPAPFDTVELSCPVARSVADSVGGSVRVDALGDVYPLIAIDSAGAIGERTYDAPPGVGAILAHVSGTSVLWLSEFLPAHAGDTVGIEAFALDADGVAYIYGRSDGDVLLGPADALPGPATFLVALDREGALVFLRSSSDAAGLPEIRALASGPDGGLAALIADDTQTLTLARLDPRDGHELARLELGSGAWIAPQRLAIDAQGGAVITGLASGDLRLGDEWQRGDPDARRSFVATYDAAGALGYQRGFPGVDELMDVAVQPSGLVYLAGRFTPPIDFGGGVSADTGTHFLLQLRP